MQQFAAAFPEQWHFLAPYFTYLLVPPGYTFVLDELHRLAYGNLQLFQLFMDEAILYPYTYVPTPADKVFVDTFYEKRVLQVGKLLSQMDEYNYEPSPWLFTGLQTMAHSCPRCESKARLFGYTPADGHADFRACSLVCTTCRIILFDIKELMLAGLPVHFNNTVAPGTD